MTIEDQIRERLDVLSPLEIRVENESHQHSGDRNDTHFKLVLVSDEFAGKRLVQRHQLIYKLVDDLMRNPIHALAMHLYTQDEWNTQQGLVPDSPNCMGGSKRDNV